MHDWIKKNRDTILITGVAVIATAAVSGVTYYYAGKNVTTHTKHSAMRMAMIAQEAGVLDKIIEHQNKLEQIIPN